MNVHSVENALALEDYRQQFSESAGYLDFARIGPLSTVVAEQKVANIDRMKTAGPSVLEYLDNLVDKARAATSTLLDAKHHEVAFVGSTSHGMFAAAQALSPQTGTVLVPRNDFPANTYPWIRAAERGGLAVRWIDGPVTAESVRDALDSERQGSRGVGSRRRDRLPGSVGTDQGGHRRRPHPGRGCRSGLWRRAVRCGSRRHPRRGRPKMASCGLGCRGTARQGPGGRQTASRPGRMVRRRGSHRAPENFRTQPFPARWPTR